MQVARLTRALRYPFLLAIAIVAVGCDSGDEAPIVKSIGLTPATDITSERGFQVHRELVYLNKDKDPEFFSKIVSSIERSSTIADFGCTKKPGRDMRGETLGQSGFSDDQITESVIFRSEDSRFHCSVSNGGEFVLVIIYTT